MTYQLQILGLSIGLVFAGTAAKLTGRCRTLSASNPGIAADSSLYHRASFTSVVSIVEFQREQLPETVGSSQYGERLTAAVAILSSENYQSHSKVQTLLNRLFWN
jgi:hypothetical protein